MEKARDKTIMNMVPFSTMKESTVSAIIYQHHRQRLLPPGLPKPHKRDPTASLERLAFWLASRTERRRTSQEAGFFSSAPSGPSAEGTGAVLTGSHRLQAVHFADGASSETRDVPQYLAAYASEPSRYGSNCIPLKRRITILNSRTSERDVF